MVLPEGSLVNRVTVTVVSLVAAVSLAVVMFTTLAVGHFLTHRLDEDLAAAQSRTVRAFERGALAVEPPPGAPPTDIREARGQEVGTLTAYLGQASALGHRIDDEGTLVSLDDEVLADLAEISSASPVTTSLPGIGRYRVQVETINAVTVVTGLPTGPIEAVRGDVLTWGLVCALVGSVLGGAVAAVVVRRQMRPLHVIAEVAREVTTSDLVSDPSTPVRVPSQWESDHTEVGRVAVALNAMLGHVDSALEERHRNEEQARRLLADVSHELRTPLATVSGYAELGLRAGADDPRVQRTSLEKVRVEAGRMTTLVEDLLLLARLEAGRGLAHDPVDLSRLVAEAVADARITGADHQWRLDLPAEPMWVVGDESRLRQVVTNLVSNARRHTPAGTVVTTSIAADAGAVRVSVHDDGPGVAAEEVDHVFDRFVRGDAARTRTDSGAGLGLSLSRSIARAHGGDLTLTSVPGDTVFVLTLPPPLT